MPLPFPVPQSVFKAAFISSFLRFPQISSNSIEPAILILSSVRIPICKILFSFAMLQEVHKISLVDGFNCFESCVSMHDSHFPKSIIDILLIVNIQTLPMSQSVDEIALVRGLMVEYLNTMSILHVVLEITLVPPRIDMDVSPCSISLVVHHLAFVKVAIFKYYYWFSHAFSIGNFAYIYFVAS